MDTQTQLKTKVVPPDLHESAVEARNAESALQRFRAERKAEIARLRKEGHSLEWIGVVFGLSRERVRQIVRDAEKEDK